MTREIVCLGLGMRNVSEFQFDENFLEVKFVMKTSKFENFTTISLKF